MKTLEQPTTDGRLTFFVVPGPNSEPDNDLQQDDLVFGIPFKLIKRAKKMGNIYLYNDDTKWLMDDVIPANVDERFVLKFEDGQITSHDLAITV